MPQGTLALALAKLAGLKKVFTEKLSNPSAHYYDPLFILDDLTAYSRLLGQLKSDAPELFGDMPARTPPVPSKTSDNQGRGYIERVHVERVLREIEYIFEVRANSELAPPVSTAPEPRIFISHGRSSDWREVQVYIERDLRFRTLELAQEPNRGRTVLQKLEQESGACTYAVVVMTGDDETTDGQIRARENVMHEIGYFQGRFGLANVCLLHEEGTSLPSNIHGLVYIPFSSGVVSAAFGALARELRAALGESRT